LSLAIYFNRDYLLPDYFLAIITNLRGSEFSYFYFVSGYLDTGEQTTVTRFTSHYLVSHTVGSSERYMARADKAW
jgi:hypothetical protein